MANFKRNVRVVFECQCGFEDCRQALILYADRTLLFVSPGNRTAEIVTTKQIQWDQDLEPVAVAGHAFCYPDLAESLHSYLKS